MSNTITRLHNNAHRLGHQTQTLAWALALSGVPAVSRCCWCGEHTPGEAMRVAAGGDCDSCPYTGRDCLVIVTQA